MKIERFNVKQCCGGMGIALKLGSPLSATFLPLLKEAGFTEWPSFTKAGIFYVDNQELTATGAFGSNILQIKCKPKNCIDSISIIEGLLAKME